MQRTEKKSCQSRGRVAREDFKAAMGRKTILLIIITSTYYQRCCFEIIIPNKACFFICALVNRNTQTDDFKQYFPARLLENHFVIARMLLLSESRLFSMKLRTNGTLPLHGTSILQAAGNSAM